MDMYDFVQGDDMAKVVSKLKWLKQERKAVDNIKDDGNTIFISACYDPIQSFGVTDYNDHRNDSLEQLKNLIEPQLLECHQCGHYYDSEGNPVNTIMVRGHAAGYSGRFIYPSGTTAFNRKANKPAREGVTE